MSYIHFLLSSFLRTSLMCGLSWHSLIAFQALCMISLVFSRVQSGLSPEQKLYSLVCSWFFYGTAVFLELVDFLLLIFHSVLENLELELFCFWSFSRHCHLLEVGLRVVMVGREDFHRYPSHCRLLLVALSQILFRTFFELGVAPLGFGLRSPAAADVDWWE